MSGYTGFQGLMGVWGGYNEVWWRLVCLPNSSQIIGHTGLKYTGFNEGHTGNNKVWWRLYYNPACGAIFPQNVLVVVTTLCLYTTQLCIYIGQQSCGKTTSSSFSLSFGVLYSEAQGVFVDSFYRMGAMLKYPSAQSHFCIWFNQILHDTLKKKKLTSAWDFNHFLIKFQVVWCL